MAYLTNPEENTHETTSDFGSGNDAFSFRM